MIKQSLFINSSLDKQPVNSNSEWSSYMANPFDFTQYDNIQVGLKNVQFPNTAYNFSELNNRIYYEKRADSEAEITTTYFSIPTDEHYENMTDFITELNSITSQSNLNFDFSFNATTKKISVHNQTGGQLRMLSSYIFENQPNSANGRLGLSDNTGEWLENDIEQTFPNMPKLIRTNCYYLCCDIIDKDSYVPNPYLHPLILAKVSTSNFGELINEKYDNMRFVSVSDRTIDKISFFLLDDELLKVDLNGSNITLELEFLVSNNN